MSKLTGQQIRELSEKLSSTLSLSELQSVVYASTGDRLFKEYVAPNLPLRPTIQELLTALEEAGTTGLFLHHVYKLRYEHRPDVASTIKSAFPEVVVEMPRIDGDIQVQEGGKAQQDGPTKAAAPGLERNIRPHLAQLDIHIWLEKLARIERRVCRVESGGNAAGTGFLVGPSAVLTNWHVVENAMKGDQIKGVACRFDYFRLIDNTRKDGILVEVMSNGCVSHRPYSPAEATKSPNTPEPTEEELDYALLRLSSPVGGADAGGQPRGWIALPEEPVTLKQGAPLIIVQHPDGAPLKLAIDTNAVIGLNSRKTRLRYTTNTEAGSSGSPCFDMDWHLAALHHLGDPAWMNPKYNQAVPAQLIRQKITSDGSGEMLGNG